MPSFFVFAACLLLTACHQTKQAPVLPVSDSLPETDIQTSVFDNFLNGTTWRSPGPAFTEHNYDKMVLEVKQNREIQDMFGTFLKFEESTFLSYYSAQCGNDCFSSVHGSYQFIGDSTLRVQVDSLVLRGYCDKNGSTPIDKTYTYDIKPNPNNGLRLVLK